MLSLFNCFLVAELFCLFAAIFALFKTFCHCLVFVLNLLFEPICVVISDEK